MKVDAPLRELPLDKIGEEAKRLENLGFDGVWTFETTRDPFLPLVAVALATERMNIGTNIAVAFARTPFSMAQTVWDLQRASSGRLLLGLGTQVKAHVERRFSSTFEHPAARITDYIHCLRAIWNTFQSGAKPDYQGPFYQFKLINAFFNPGPIEQPEIQVYLAGVNPRMARAAGEAADGFSVHPMHSPGYLRDVVRPAIDEGAKTRGKSVNDLVLVADTFVVRGSDEKARAKSEAMIRQQVALYGSTPSYRAFLEYHGHLETGKKLTTAMREGRLADMPGLVSDDLLNAVAISEADGDLATLISNRYAGGLIQRFGFYDHIGAEHGEAAWRAFISAIQAS